MKKKTDLKRRHFLTAATTIIGGGGIVVASVPFISYMLPSARARNAGAPIVADFSKLKPGQQMTLQWRKKPIWILRRTEKNLADLKEASLRKKLTDPDSGVSSQQPEYAVNEFRSINPEYLVTIALCTHLGCIPTYRPDVGPADLGMDWVGGYFCPCHGSKFDFSGRVFRGSPAPTNLVIPPYHFLSETVVEIGGEKEATNA
ncbi:MAG: ubiquinol-cytochrome c reductase iron-sulfur subunit [Gammaproteobacteria bacterium]|nr:ubiquinol-cytochrome c reductase iron-sulfur subunit [Gammaproteobacteria bacterium]